MAFTEALRLLITADTGGAVRGINAVGAATDKSLGKSQQRIDKWSRGLTTAGAGMIAFGGAALLGLGKAAMMSEEANLSVVKLENTLGNMPKLAGENKKSFIDLAQAIQDKTAADADQIVEAEALLGTFNLTGREIRSITPLVVDLARKFGIDMSSAAVQVGKALDGNVGALKRNGISIDEALFATDRYAAVTKALREQVGGFAEEEGKTFAGSLERLKNQLGDVAEGVGTGAVDAFTSMFSVVEGGLNKFKELSPATQSLIGKVATFGSVALIAAGGVSFLLGQVIKASQNFSIARDAVASFAGAGGLGRLAKAGVVVGGLIALREILGTINDDLEDVSVAKLENELLHLGQSAEVVGPQLERILGAKGPLAAGKFTANMDEFAKGSRQFEEDINALDDALAQLAARDPEAAAAAFERITEALVRQGIPASRVKEEFNAYADAVATGKTAAETAKGGVDELTGGMENQADAISDAQSALDEYIESLTGLFDPLFGATDALIDNQDAQRKVLEAEAALAVAVRDHGAGSAEAAEAQRDLTDAQLGVGKSAVDVKQSMSELSAAVRDGSVNVADAKAMLAEWVGQGLISQSTAATLGRQFDNTAAAANKLGETDPNVRVSETGGSRTRGTLDKVQQAAVNAGRQKPNVRVGATDRASNILRNVQSLVSSLPTSRTFTFNARVTGMQELNRARALTGRQHGGPVLAREAYLVGEAGPELLLMGNQAGTIVPHGVSVPMGGSGGGVGGYVDNRVFNITTGADPHSVVRAIRQAGDLGLPITVRGRRL